MISSADRDLGRIRKFVRIVLRGKNGQLDENERIPAARYAAILSVTLPFTLGYVTLLYAGIATQALGVMARDHGSEDGIFGPWYLVALVVVLVVVFPLQIMRIVRARRYVRAHSDLLDSASSA